MMTPAEAMEELESSNGNVERLQSLRKKVLTAYETYQRWAVRMEGIILQIDEHRPS